MCQSPPEPQLCASHRRAGSAAGSYWSCGMQLLPEPAPLPQPACTTAPARFMHHELVKCAIHHNLREVHGRQVSGDIAYSESKLVVNGPGPCLQYLVQGPFQRRHVVHVIQAAWGHAGMCMCMSACQGLGTTSFQGRGSMHWAEARSSSALQLSIADQT